MALFFECMEQCAQKLLDIADIVRDAILRQLPTGAVSESSTSQDLATREAARHFLR
jgi:hypothetical protein